MMGLTMKPDAIKPLIQRTTPPRQCPSLSTLLGALHHDHPADDDIGDLVDGYRAEAGRLIGNGSTAYGEPELLALALFERDLSRLPSEYTVASSVSDANAAGDGALSPPLNIAQPCPLLPPPASPQHLTDLSAYTANLAAALSGSLGHQLAPAVLDALNRFNVAKILDAVPVLFQPALAMPNTASNTAAQLSEVALPDGLTVLGSWNENETTVISTALARMHSLLPGSRGLVHQVVIRTFIEGTEHFQVAGLHVSSRATAGVPGEVHVGRWLSPADLARTLYHEAGHELYSRFANVCSAPDSPFGRTSSPLDYVSEYAMVSPEEDFAETHADMLANWDLFSQARDVYMFGEGGQAEKRRFILEKCYGFTVAPPGERWQRLTEDACAAGSPFCGAGPTVNDSLTEFRHAVARLNRTDPDSSIMDPKLRWILAHAGPRQEEQ